jgi:hypothetical protein
MPAKWLFYQRYSINNISEVYEMENCLMKIVKWFPRKIKRKLAAEISRGLNISPINKLLLKQISEIISGVEFIGQELQDMYAYLYFKGKKDGFFIDIGAYDGITISNTYALEKIGWKGICVEPVPEIYDRLIKNRKCECIKGFPKNNNYTLSLNHES